MNARLYNNQYKIFRSLFLMLLGVVITSCSIYDDDEYCPTGFYIQFKYDYNMKFADAFSNEVDRVTVYVFDQEGKFLMQKTEEGSALKSKDYKMTLDIEPGTYQLIAWAGLDGTSFRETNQLVEQTSLISAPNVELITSNQNSNTDLHPLWHGERLDVTVPTNRYEETTISLVKDTKRIRMVLQQLNGLPIADGDFKFEITDDNSLFDFHNNLIPTGTTTYTPYTTGTSTVGDTDVVTAAFFEASTNRLMEKSKARLRITRVADNQTIIDIPLIDYLLLTELEGHKGTMTPQEYLDRQDEYSLVFFLDNNLSWLQVQIIVNGWVVRFNDGEF